ncbi:MAG: hypothetical protein VCF07_06115, partial [Nitrospinota bacterium]
MIASDSRVLIVEGQARLRWLLDTMFHVSGVKTIHSVPDRKLAREILLTHPIDVVLYDWSTP